MFKKLSQLHYLSAKWRVRTVLLILIIRMGVSFNRSGK